MENLDLIDYIKNKINYKLSLDYNINEDNKIILVEIIYDTPTVQNIVNFVNDNGISDKFYKEIIDSLIFAIFDENIDINIKKIINNIIRKNKIDSFLN